MSSQRIITITVQDDLCRQVLEQGLIMDGWLINKDETSPGFLRIGDRKTEADPFVMALPSGKIRLGDILTKARHASDDKGRAVSGTLNFSYFALDLAGLILKDQRNGRTIILTEKERDILIRLHRADGKALDRKTLLADIWSYADTVDTHTVETHIYRLRQKIEDDPSKPHIIITEGNGYFLGDGA